MFKVVHCADVSADHIILGELSRSEIVDGWFRQLACPALLSGERLVRPHGRLYNITQSILTVLFLVQCQVVIAIVYPMNLGAQKGNINVQPNKLVITRWITRYMANPEIQYSKSFDILGLKKTYERQRNTIVGREYETTLGQ